MTEELSIRTGAVSQTESCGEALASLLEPGDVLLLSGDLGAGKTALTKGIARGLGVDEPVTSPTFNIMLQHSGSMTLNHFDLYRLERAEELDDIDYFGTLESGGVSVVEWGDRFDEARPSDGLLVRMHITGDEERTLELLPIGPRGERLAGSWVAACGALSDHDRGPGGGLQ